MKEITDSVDEDLETKKEKINRIIALSYIMLFIDIIIYIYY